jgi:hypothetical protein
MPPPDAKRRPAWEPTDVQDQPGKVDGTEDTAPIKPESALVAWRRERRAAKRAAEVPS